MLRHAVGQWQKAFLCVLKKILVKKKIYSGSTLHLSRSMWLVSFFVCDQWNWRWHLEQAIMEFPPRVFPKTAVKFGQGKSEILPKSSCSLPRIWLAMIRNIKCEVFVLRIRHFFSFVSQGEGREAPNHFSCLAWSDHADCPECQTGWFSPCSPDMCQTMGIFEWELRLAII